MGVIRSPLGALGALMVLLDAIAAGALFPLKDQPELQRYVVLLSIGSIGLITLLVCGLVIYFAIRRPGLLFSPTDIDPAVHMDLYGPGDRPTVPSQLPSLSFEVQDENE